MKKIVINILLLCILINSVFASNLALMSLEDASDDELLLMCNLRNLDCNLDRDTLISTLEKQFIEEYGSNQFKEIEKDIVENQVSFRILSANSLKILNDTNSLLLLEGNVELLFEEGSENERRINAQKIILDNENSKLVALKNVNYNSNEATFNSFSQDISANIISYNWESENLFVNNGIIKTDRENSDSKKVSFYANSSSINIDGINNSLILKNGYITTNLNKAYFSISADKIALLNHGDMYFEKAKIYIGRVPILYLPYFFSPGATMVANPAIGYESSRGSFVNTTFEIFGKYPNFKSTSTNSFNSFLQNNNEGDNYSNGIIYNSSDSDSEIEKWAKESNSYFAIMLDAYEMTKNSIGEEADNGSIVFSYAYQLNLLNKSLKLESFAISALASDGKSVIDKINYYPKFRYNIEFKNTLELKDGKIQFYIPLLSDPKVKSSYANRLSTFNIDFLWNDNQSFPTTYNSDITSYSWYFNLKYQFNFNKISPFISQIKINEIESKFDYKWELFNGIYSYKLEDITFPKLDINVVGTIIDLKESEKTDREKEVDIPLVYDKLYKITNNNQANNEELSSLNIAYTIDNDYSVKFDSDDNKDVFTQSQLNIKTKANLEPNIFSLNNNLKVNYNYEQEISKENILLNIYTTNKIGFDKINLNYYFDTLLYKYEYKKDTQIDESDILSFNFSDDFISKHELELLDTYNIYDLKITPAINLVLPPLQWALKPSLLFNLNNITNKTIFTFDIDSNNFDLIEITNNLQIKFNKLTLDFDVFYDIEESYTSTSFLDSLVVDTNIIYFDKEKNQYFSHTNKYYGLYDGEKNYFSKFNFIYKNSFLVSKLNLLTEDNSLTLDYFKNTISLTDLEKYWWKNRIALKLDLDATFNYSYSDIYSTYFSLETSLKYRIAEFLLIDFKLKTSNYSFYKYYENGKFNFINMFDDLLNSFDIFGGNRYSTQFNLESVSFELIHMMEDWDLHCKGEGSVVLSNYKYQWVPSVSIFLQWKALPELKIDQNFTNEGNGWQ